MIDSNAQLERRSTVLRRKKDDKRVAAERFGKLIKAFGETVSEVLDDPELKEKAKEFA